MQSLLASVAKNKEDRKNLLGILSGDHSRDGDLSSLGKALAQRQKAIANKLGGSVVDETQNIINYLQPQKVYARKEIKKLTTGK